MNKDNKFEILVIAVPFLGLLYCAIVLGCLIYSPWMREHPIITAAIFTIAPSLVSGSIWLYGSAKAKNKERLGL